MTKKQESPYQISLDIPFKTVQEKQASYLASPPEISPASLNEEGLQSEDNFLSEPETQPSLNATQISLLDELPIAQSIKEATIAHIESQLSQSEQKQLASQNPETSLKLEQEYGNRLAESPITEPYLLPVGSIISSPGGHFSYRILGACCRLFDRAELPWPCCRIQWHSKEPSWRRIGKRFVPDLATKRFPSYMVEILDHEYSREPFVLTLYWRKFPSDIQNWWYTKYTPPSR